MTVELEFVRIEVNNAFDRWLYWQLRLRDLINAADSYSCEAFDVSARRIKAQLRHSLLDSLSKIHRFECLRERMEELSHTDHNASEPPEASQ